MCTIELRLASNDSFNSSTPFVEHDIPNKICDRLTDAVKPDTYIADKNNFELRISKEDCTIRYLRLDNYSNPKLDAVLNDLLLYKKDLMNKVNRFPGGINDVDWVQYKLKILVDIDQKARWLQIYPEQNKLEPIDKAYFKGKLQPITKDIDLEARSALKDLLNKYTWFSISKFGKQADVNGWLLVQHQDQDREFQTMVLKRLQKLYPFGETDKTNYAYLYDRVSVTKHKRQRYGTQGYCSRNGQWMPWPSLDSQDFDVYRKEMGMRFTMSQYKKLVTDSACFAKKP